MYWKVPVDEFPLRMLSPEATLKLFTDVGGEYLSAGELVSEYGSIEVLNDLLARLNGRQRTVVISLYALEGGEPAKQAEVSSLLGVSRMRVLQIKREAAQVLRREIFRRRAMAAWAAAKTQPEKLAVSVYVLDIPVRVLNALLNNSSHRHLPPTERLTLGDVVGYSEEYVLDLRGLGQRGVDKLKEALRELGLGLKED